MLLPQTSSVPGTRQTGTNFIPTMLHQHAHGAKRYWEMSSEMILPVTGFDKSENLRERIGKDAFRLKDCKCTPAPKPRPAAFSVLPAGEGLLFLFFS